MTSIRGGETHEALSIRELFPKTDLDQLEMSDEWWVDAT